MYWNISEFIEQVDYWNRRYIQFFKYIYEDIYLQHSYPYVLSYEDLQYDTNMALQRMFNTISNGISMKQINVNLTDRQLNEGWIKRTNEDLSKVLYNFNDIVHYLNQSSNQTHQCYLQQLLSTTISTGNTISTSSIPGIYSHSCLHNKIPDL